LEGEVIGTMFNTKGYHVVRNVIADDALKLLALDIQLQRSYYHFSRGIPEDYIRGDAQVEKSYSVYGASCFEALMVLLQPKIEQITGKSLYPTYSYARIYYNGAELTRHKDRPACEYSASLCIENDEYPWPFFMEDYNGNAEAVELYPGDMIVYRGNKLHHWREPFTLNKQIQTFLHYVDQNGEHSDKKYDDRPMLIIPKMKMR